MVIFNAIENGGHTVINVIHESTVFHGAAMKPHERTLRPHRCLLVGNSSAFAERQGVPELLPGVWLYLGPMGMIACSSAYPACDNNTPTAQAVPQPSKLT